MRRTIRSMLCLATALAALLSTTAAAGGHPGSIDWKPCPEHRAEAGLRCATLDLPVDWARPGGATFSLAIVKRAATDPAARIGPLLVGTGGPGLSGVQYVFDADRNFSPEVRRRFDIVGFDPRGVARSSPAVCSAATLAQMPPYVPSTKDQFEEWIAYNRRLSDDCRAHAGPLFDHADTIDVARDLDAIRAALGERQISYHGVSYGTLIGQTYAEMFPNRVRSMVLDSVMDHSLRTKPFLVTQAAAAEDAFNEFAAWCDRSASCVLHGRDVGAVYDSLMRRAEAGTLVDPASGAPMTWFGLSEGTYRTFYGPNWIGLAAWLDALDKAAPAALARTSPAALARTSPATVEMPLATVCGDWAVSADSFTELSRYLAASRKVAPHLRLAAGPIPPTMVCLGWQGRIDNPQHRLRVRTSVPLLVINSRHDAVTPYSWAVNVADQLGDRGRLVTYAGWGHGVTLRTPCTIGYVDRYLIDRALPPAGAACPAAPPA